MKCLKYIFVIINALYLILSLLMISLAVTLKVVLVGSIRWDFDALSNLWISAGCFLFVISIFGIVAAVKESTLMANLYGFFLSLIFILQMATAITGFVLIAKSSGIVWQTLNNFMWNYEYDFDSRNTMNLIQTSLSCCGNESPSDWQKHGQYSTSTNGWSWTTNSYIDATTPSASSTINFQQSYKTPQSCCLPDSGYENMSCDSHFTTGCHAQLRAIVSESVIQIGISALVIGLIQILGIIFAFMLARTIRRSKTHRDIQKWTNHQNMNFDRQAYVDQLPIPEGHQNMGFDKPTYVDYLPDTTPETQTDEIKHI